MRDQEITLGTQVIAHFMGWRYIRNAKQYVHRSSNGLEIVAEDKLQFHQDWNILMEAAGKFDDIYKKHKWDVSVRSKYNDLCDDIDRAVSRYKIGKAFEHLVKAINWYYTPFQ